MYFRGLTYAEFASSYLNKLNPNTGGYWRTDEIAAATGSDVATVERYIAAAQRANISAVESRGTPLTPAELENVTPPPAPVIPTYAPPPEATPPFVPPSVTPDGDVIPAPPLAAGWDWTTIAIIGLGIWALARR